MTQENTVYTLRKLPQFSSMCHQKPGNMWEFILKVLEQEEWNVALGQAKCVKMSALPGELSCGGGNPRLREIGTLDWAAHV